MNYEGDGGSSLTAPNSSSSGTCSSSYFSISRPTTSMSEASGWDSSSADLVHELIEQGDEALVIPLCMRDEDGLREFGSVSECRFEGVGQFFHAPVSYSE